jgi:glycosyltransferase involved in cell wall biosynthesis
MLKRIGFFLDSFAEGGGERVIVYLSNYLVSKQYKVDLVVVRDAGLYKETLSPLVNKIVLYHGAHSCGIFARIARKCAVYFRLLRYFSRNPPDVFLSTMRRDNLIVSKIYHLAGRFSGGRFPLILREADVIDDGEDPKVIARMRRWYKTARFTIANSDVTKNDLVVLIGLESNRVKRIYNPMILAKTAPSENTLGVRKRGAQNPRILGCGRFVKKKNFKDLVAVFAMLLEDIPGAELTILGDGEEKVNLEKQIRELKLEGKVRLPGLVKDPFPYYGASDVFVQTSLWEGFGYVLPEAMSRGTPVVCYNGKGAMAEILENGKYGTLVEPGNLAALKEAIIRQIENPVSPELLRESVKRFDINVIAEQYLDVLKSAVA